MLRDSAYMFSKSRFFLALILLGPWVRASCGAPPEGVTPYWTLCTEACQINGLLNSRKFHVYRPTNDVDFEDLELRQRRGERAAISFDQFVLSPEPVEFSGEREWSLVVGGVGHLFGNNYCYRCHQNRLGFGRANYAPNPRREPTRGGADFVIEH